MTDRTDRSLLLMLCLTTLEIAGQRDARQSMGTTGVNPVFHVNNVILMWRQRDESTENDKCSQSFILSNAILQRAG